MNSQQNKTIIPEKKIKSFTDWYLLKHYPRNNLIRNAAFGREARIGYLTVYQNPILTTNYRMNM